MYFEPIIITRTINGNEVEIELEWDEMWKAREVCRLEACAEDIQDMFEAEIPKDDLIGYAEEMVDMIVYNDFGWTEARDTVCENNGLYG